MQTLVSVTGIYILNRNNFTKADYLFSDMTERSVKYRGFRWKRRFYD